MLFCQTLSPRFPSSFGLQIDFGAEAGLALDVSKKILCLYNKYDVTSGGDSAPKAEILEPGLVTMIMQTIMPCGSQLLYRIRDTDSDEDLWHIRTPEVCCHIACCPVRLHCLPYSRPSYSLCASSKPTSPTLPWPHLCPILLRVAVLGLPPCECLGVRCAIALPGPVDRRALNCWPAPTALPVAPCPPGSSPQCPPEVSYTFHICKADSKESEGTITVTAKTCLATVLLASTSSISVDFPSESSACSVASKHAIMCAAMLLDAAVLGSRSFCA